MPPSMHSLDTVNKIWAAMHNTDFDASWTTTTDKKQNDRSFLCIRFTIIVIDNLQLFEILIDWQTGLTDLLLQSNNLRFFYVLVSGAMLCRYTFIVPSCKSETYLTNESWSLGSRLCFLALIACILCFTLTVLLLRSLLTSESDPSR